MKTFFSNDAVKAVILLCVAIIVIMIANPPRTVCDPAVESYLNTVKPLAKNFSSGMTLCRTHTDLGGCVGLFEVIRRLQLALDDVNSQCRETLSKDKITSQWIHNSMEIYVRVAWGSRPPINRWMARGWLESTHVNSFCKLKSTMTEIWGAESWAGFVDKMLEELPGASALGRDEAWTRSLMSDSCRF